MICYNKVFIYNIHLDIHIFLRLFKNLKIFGRELNPLLLTPYFFGKLTLINVHANSAIFHGNNSRVN